MRIGNLGVDKLLARLAFALDYLFLLAAIVLAFGQPG
jgi:preprotein translocase subunit SecG